METSEASPRKKGHHLHQQQLLTTNNNSINSKQASKRKKEKNAATTDSSKAKKSKITTNSFLTINNNINNNNNSNGIKKSKAPIKKSHLVSNSSSLQKKSPDQIIKVPSTKKVNKCLLTTGTTLTTDSSVKSVKNLQGNSVKKTVKATKPVTTTTNNNNNSSSSNSKPTKISQTTKDSKFNKFKTVSNNSTNHNNNNTASNNNNGHPNFSFNTNFNNKNNLKNVVSNLNFNSSSNTTSFSSNNTVVAADKRKSSVNNTNSTSTTTNRELHSFSNTGNLLKIPTPPNPTTKGPPEQTIVALNSEKTAEPVKKVRKVRKPVAEEDIIDGFTFLAFKSFDEVKRAIKLGEESTTDKNAANTLCVQLIKGSRLPNSTNGKSGKLNQEKTPDAPIIKLVERKKEVEKKDSFKLPNINKTKKKAKENTNVIPNKMPNNETSINFSTKQDIGVGTEESATIGKPKKALSGSKKKAAKISDGGTGLFALPRKDSSPNQLDNLNSPDKKESDSPENLVNHKISPSIENSSTSSPRNITKSKSETVDLILPNTTPQIPSNGLVNREQNGHCENDEQSSSGEKQPGIGIGQKSHKLFTPYATNSITTTRVSTPSESGSSHSISDRLDNEQTESDVTKNNSFNFNGSESEQLSNSPPVLEKCEIPARVNSVNKSSQGSGSNSKSTGFESIERLLDSSSKPSKSYKSSSNKSSRNRRNSSNSSPNYHSVGTSTNVGGSSQTLSPRGQSPSRERESYSSSVSSLSRTSVTPVNGSSALPPNLSPLLSLSHSKTASWLSGTTPGLSPVPRPTPPPSSSAGQLNISTTGPLFSGLPPQSTSHSSAAMFAPMVPLTSMIHPPQPSPFGTGQDNIFQASQNELMRRDLESRIMAERNAGGPNTFLAGHPMIPHLSGVNHLPSPGGQALFPPPFFKDLSKMGMDSQFYRSLGLPYSGFNGMLPPSGISTPFTPPREITQIPPKKTGRWNAMHVRIAWEIYHHQQKTGSDNKTTIAPSNTKNSVTKSSNNATTTSSPMSLTQSEVTRSPFPDIRPPDVGQSPFPSFLTNPPRPQFDQSLLLQNPSHLAPVSRSFAASGPLGPSFSGISGLGSSLLGRDVPGLMFHPSHEAWLRMQRTQFPLSSVNSSLPTMPSCPSRDLRPEPFGQKDDRNDKRNESESKSGHRDVSPRDRSRSPIRRSRTPVENGDIDSRSSSGNSASTKNSGHKSREEGIGYNDREKLSLPSDREKFSQHNFVTDKSLPFSPSNYSSRLLSPITSGWDFPGAAGSRISNYHQLSERERELARGPVQLPTRPIIPPNSGSFLNLPPPRPSSSGSTKSNSSGGSIQLLNSSMSTSTLGALSYGQHHHSSPNGQNSPTKSEESYRKTKEESHVR